jgi:hypothetical protein
MISEALYGESRAICLIRHPPGIAADPVVVPVWTAGPVYYYPSAPAMDNDPPFNLPHVGSILASSTPAAADLPIAADATSTELAEEQSNVSAVFSGVPVAAVPPPTVPAVAPTKPERTYVLMNFAASASSPASSSTAVTADVALLTAASRKRGRPREVTTTDTEPAPGAVEGEVAGALLPATQKTQAQKPCASCAHLPQPASIYVVGRRR